MRNKIIFFAALLLIIGGACLLVFNGKQADEKAGEPRIAIAWRADTDNEFCTNVVEAFRAAGIEVVVLPQVKAPYISYEGDRVSATCLDSAGIGYLSIACGAMVRSNSYEGSNAGDVLTGVDGVIFTGGEDISPTLYAVQEDWHHIEAEIDFNAARDVSDYLTMSYCLDHDIPVIGLCRGSQMLGVVSGATMIQDLPTWFADKGLTYNYEHRRNRAEGETYRDYTPHTVTVAGGSLLAGQLLSTGSRQPNPADSTTMTLEGCPSWHHQAILSVEGTPLRCVGTTSTSGVDMIEAIERTDKTCAVGLQFHPEAAIAKHLGKGVCNTNADRFMAYGEAMNIFKNFISISSRERQ